MLANPLEVFPIYRDQDSPSKDTQDALPTPPIVNPERRIRVRTTVHWPVLFFRDGSGDAIETVTQNLSSSGFYCHSQTLMAPGEVLLCAIKFPSHDLSGHERSRVLECRVQVKRVEAGRVQDSFGIACQIHDYRLVVGDGQANGNP